MGLKIALELILKYYLLNKTKILSILEAKIFKTVNCTRHGCFSSTGREFQFLRTNKKGFDKMKIKIIDLLNKIANKEQVPEKIKYENKIWEYDVYSNDYIFSKKN